MIAKIGRVRWLGVGSLILGSLLYIEGARSQEALEPQDGKAGHARGTPMQLVVGAVLPLTGSYAEYGENARAALEVAAEDIARVGTLRIRVAVEDDQADPRKAVTALQKLVSVDGARFVIGGFTSSCSEAMYPIAERFGVLMFSPATSTPSLTQDTPMFFRNWPSDRDQARVFADQTIKRFKKKTASLLYSRSEYGVDVEALFREAYEKMGGKVVIEEAYKPKENDFRAQIKRFMDNPADCIWLFGYYNEMAHFLRQARIHGLRTQFFGQEGIEAVEFLQIAGGAAEGLIYFVPVFDPSDDSQHIKWFVSAFEAKLGRTPDVLAAHAYDALHILAQAIEVVGPDPHRVAQQLPKTKNYPGVAGLTTLDENGDAKKPLMIKTIREGSFVRWAEP